MFESLMTNYSAKHLLNTFLRKGILPNPDILFVKLGKNYETYHEMTNDSHIWSCIQSRKSGTLSLKYNIEPLNSIPDYIELINYYFNEINLNKLKNEILDAIFFGMQVIELNWDYRNFNGKNYLLPIEFKTFKQENFVLNSDEQLCIKTNNLEYELVPEYKFLLVLNEADESNPYGDAVLKKCYWYLTFKNGVIRFWINYAEKYGSPLLLGQFQRGATEEEARNLADALAGMSQDAVIVTPSDFKIELAESNRSASSELFRELIKHCNNEISKAILSQTLTTEIESGSYAAANIHYKIRKELIKSDCYLVENSLNTLIKYIFEVNNLGNNLPKFKHIIDDSDNNARLERDLKLLNNGIKFSKQYLIENYGFKESDLL